MPQSEQQKPRLGEVESEALRERLESGLPPPTPTEEYFREVHGVIARRHWQWVNQRWFNRAVDIDEAERFYQRMEKQFERELADSSPKEQEAFYIRETIDCLQAFWQGSAIMDAASILTDEDLETMRPYDPEFIDEILSARPNHPAARAKAERSMQRIKQAFNNDHPPRER
jgi:hypothetical protein